jgi:uncharacterized MAPEG superfamily protein
MDQFGSIELQMLAASAVLGLVQLVLAVLFSVAARGMPWALGPRDSAGAPLGTIGGRMERAFKNFLETFPIFAVAALIATALNRHTVMTVLGAQLYFWARVAFVPIYALGIPVARTLVWAVALIGIVLVLQVGWLRM